MSPTPFHAFWRDQCEAARAIQDRYGIENALDYLVGEKLMNFMEASKPRLDSSAFPAKVFHSINPDTLTVPSGGHYGIRLVGVADAGRTRGSLREKAHSCLSSLRLARLR